MAKEDVKKIIQKAKENEEFMVSILQNAQQALQSYNLSQTELEFFQTADRKTIEGLKDSCFELAK
ncbi:hypothetical protein [Candidatus Uabimicrobium amorphum]|uniref:Nif11 domain-containing protein n=1 Tax=Uabimicrobium amorphum TaxID=2596890 RepID=A0A5S9IQ54_UABAM|nr:hypothetical protein [Candidatus Uabimicrobium amorphum]BBM86053.1 hypothetical protein UABAM_04439 [Candidatus Uabimicrobium amorphum]